jgi:uncharacterized MAPEG superfamily protein
VLACDLPLTSQEAPIRARVAHAVVYTIGTPILCTLCFAIGFLAQVVLGLAIFEVV